MQNKKHTYQMVHEIFFSRFTLLYSLMLAPVIVVSYTLQNAVAVAIAFVVITFGSVLLGSFIPKNWIYPFRVMIHLALASLLFIPAALLVNFMHAGLAEQLGIYLPILITNSLIVQKSETIFRNLGTLSLVKELCVCIVGFTLLICVIGFIREWLSFGSIWGVPIITPWLPAAKMPFFGFMIVGFFAALLRMMKYSGKEAV